MTTKPLLLVDNRLADGVPVATTTASGHSPWHLIDWHEHTYHKSNAGGTQVITVDCGVAKSANAIGLAGYNLNALGASVAVECSDDDFAADITVASASASIEDLMFFMLFAVQSKRYWRLVFTDLSGPFYLSIAAIGMAIEFEEPIYGDYTPERIEPAAKEWLSQEGHPLGITRGIVETRSRLAFDDVTDAWYRANLKPAWDSHLSKGLPAFFVPFYAAHPEDVFLYRVVASSGFDAPYVNGGKRRLGLDLRGVYRPEIETVVEAVSYCSTILEDSPEYYWPMNEGTGLEIKEAIAGNYLIIASALSGSGWLQEGAVACSDATVGFGFFGGT